ncbi:ABC transporter ATP-binding protein [Hirschia maritima]|uniref:ABC transporter ATP-binding protein n=1 Tax=Hirschia maritima TaxID=1121961 RepID=UPI00035F31C7|nr:ABC transporter ATP-binding protein [Hirschia maritima]
MTARVSLQNVTVYYPMHLDERSRSFRYWLASHFVRKEERRRYNFGLHRINLLARPGDRIGIIGRNGAGKTTLLRTIAGVFEPDQGKITRYGHTVSLINLSMGMDMYASGVENIRRRAILYGISDKAEIEKLIEDVSQFSELNEFINEPIRSYSSGMLARLSFGIATAVSADIVLMDEWISAGDARFIDRAEKRMAEYLGDDKIVFLASHSAALVRKWCNKVIVLDQGEIKYFSDDIAGGITYLHKLLELEA